MTTGTFMLPVWYGHGMAIDHTTLKVPVFIFHVITEVINNVGNSKAVTHQDTRPARHCLTSVI